MDVLYVLRNAEHHLHKKFLVTLNKTIIISIQIFYILYPLPQVHILTIQIHTYLHLKFRYFLCRLIR